MEEIEFFFNLEKEQNLQDLEEIARIVIEKPPVYDTKTVFLRKFVTALFMVGEGKIKPKQAITEKATEKIEKPKPLQPKLEIPKPVILKPLIAPSPKFPEYPLVVTSQGKVLVKASLSDNTYYLNEPALSPPDLDVLAKLKKKVGSRLAGDSRLANDKKYMLESIKKMAGSKVDDDYYEKMRYYLVRDILGFGIIDAMLKDKNIKEIYCDGADKTLYLTYNNEKKETKIKYENEKDIDLIINKFAGQSGQKLGSEPFLDAKLVSGVSISAIRGLGLTSSKYVIKK